MKKILAAAIGAGALVALGAVAPANAAEGPAKLSVLHGVPGLTVDVYVNDALTLDDFEPGDLAGPLELPAGTYSVAITASDAADASAPAIGPVDLPLEAGKDYTAVAHLTEAGEPTATLFTNDISQTGSRRGPAHGAACRCRTGGRRARGRRSGHLEPDEPERAAPQPARRCRSASVAAAGTTDPVIGPADVDVAEGVNTIVYAWGSLEDDNLALAVQTIGGLHSSPEGVPAGVAGLAATNAPGVGTEGWVVIGAAILAAAALALAALRRRRPAEDRH